MARMVQIRNMPDAMHRILKARAAMAGMSLSDYLLSEMKQVVARPTLEEFRQRLQRRRPVALPISAAQAIRAEREGR